MQKPLDEFKRTRYRKSLTVESCDQRGLAKRGVFLVSGPQVHLLARAPNPPPIKPDTLETAGSSLRRGKHRKVSHMIHLLILLIIVGAILYVLQLLPIDAMIARIIQVISIAGLVIWLLRTYAGGLL